MHQSDDLYGIAARSEEELFCGLFPELAAAQTRSQLLRALTVHLRPLLGFDRLLLLVQAEKGGYRDWLNETACKQEDRVAADAGGLPQLGDTPIITDMGNLPAGIFNSGFVRSLREEGAKRLALAGVQVTEQRRGVLTFISRNPGVFPGDPPGLLRRIMPITRVAVCNVYRHEAMAAAQRQEAGTGEIRRPGNIVGTGAAMQQVFELVSQVASSPTTVLLLGETGTGKELIARALHDASARKGKAMIKVNCASLPASLIESELFGHEKGSFTGATERRVGKFEMANHSTLFLDEIGELPPDLQVKLLRALQEKEIERIGGNSAIKVDVRIIAATNRNLLEEVQAGNFRNDLYYRLNVFPISLPPLRDRREDIPALAEYFLLKHGGGRSGLPRFSARAIKELTAYGWPGNVRELEHLIERTLITVKGSTIDNIDIPSSGGHYMQGVVTSMRVKTIDEVEREHIIAVLKRANGKISGIGGAAEMLCIPSTTLNSKIRRLNIKKGLIDSVG